MKSKIVLAQFVEGKKEFFSCHLKKINWCLRTLLLRITCMRFCCNWSASSVAALQPTNQNSGLENK